MPQPSKAGQGSPYRRLSARGSRARDESAAMMAGFGMASEYEDRKGLTFERAEGAEPLPSQLELKEVSPELRARLWRIFHQWLSVMTVSDSIVPGHRYLEGQFVPLLYDWHVTRCFKAADEFRTVADIGLMNSSRFLWRMIM